MAIDLGTTTLAVKERTYRIELLSPLGNEAKLVIYREKVWLDEAGTVIRREESDKVYRDLVDIAEMKIGTMTGGEMAVQIAAAADILRQQDIDAAAQAEQPTE